MGQNALRRWLFWPFASTACGFEHDDQ
jgi:hypothetical protein